MRRLFAGLVRFAGANRLHDAGKLLDRVLESVRHAIQGGARTYH